MNFCNASGCEAGWMMGFERDGRELLVAIVKATYDLPPDGGEASLSAKQQPLVQEDLFTGAPDASAPLLETDYAPRKPGCDVLLVGSAHAPAGTQVTRLPVSLQLGPLAKSFLVVGDRHWDKGLLGVRASEPQPFTTLPLNYDHAFGGTDRTEAVRGGTTKTFLANPVGCGYWQHTEHIDGQPLPNTEEPEHVVSDPAGRYRPMALSPIGRHWTPRAAYAGTYDAQWLEEKAPFWPDDFDYRYFQAAPPDQVIPYPTGGETVALHNLTRDGLRRFRLPSRRVPVTFVPYRGRDVIREALLDTIVFEPDQERMTLTWRAGLALGRSVFDVKETIAGEMSEAWQRARRFPDKTYHRRLSDAVAARRSRSSQ